MQCRGQDLQIYTATKHQGVMEKFWDADIQSTFIGKEAECGQRVCGLYTLKYV